MSEIKLKDFILDEIPEPEKKVYADKPPVEYTFTVEYENDTDFILRRVTSKTDRSLVCIVSQAQIYIKDNKNDKVERVASKDQLIKFKSGLIEKPSFDKLIWTPFEKEVNWSSRGREHVIKVSDEFSSLLNDKETFKQLANKKLNPFKEYNMVYEYKKAPELFNKKLEVIKIIQKLKPEFNMNDYWASETIKGFIDCGLYESVIDKNIELLDELNRVEFVQWLRLDGFTEILKDYRVDFSTLMSYLLYTIKYRNGLNIYSYNGNSRDGFSFSDYRDYLSNQKEMYGKVKEKYPQYWLSEKQMMINKYNAWRKMQEAIGFRLNQEEMKQYEYDDGFFSVIVPIMSSEILDEADQQHHCVASYVDRVRDGKTHILFIRYSDRLEESLLTVEVNTNNEIVQVRGFMNRAYNRCEWDFMKEWADKKKLKLMVKEPVEKDEEV